MNGRRILLGCLAVAVTAVTSACSSEAPLTRPVVEGLTGTTVVLAADGPGRQAMARAISAYTRKRERVELLSGSADAVAASIKDGRPVDVVVLPAGTAMDRVRDELLAPPIQLGDLHGTPYLAAAVTTRGRPFIVTLDTTQGSAMLRAGGLS